ncbi:MAG: gliding motility-associated C-terminal domain-containing protein [Bacteroidota bacterium]
MKNIILTICLLISYSFCFSQFFSNQGMTVSITSNTIFSVRGDAVNNGTIINDGNLFISGSWINNMNYEAENGSFILNNPGEQIINHNAQSFANFEITGGGQKIFLADLTVNRRIDLQEGILVGTNDSKLILSEGIEIIGGSEDSYINGALVRSGSNELFFPVGTDREYLPILFDQIADESPQITVQAFSSPAANSADDNLLPSDLRHWQVESVDLTDVALTLPLIDENFDASVEDLVVVGATTAGGFQNLGARAVNGTLTSGEITSTIQPPFDVYTVASTSAEGTLPAVSVVNAVTPSLQDGKHDFLRIDNIESYPNNKVEIFNRWGDKVYEMNGYDNVRKIFTGRGNVSNIGSLASGTFYYVIDLGSSERMTGFFLLIN